MTAPAHWRTCSVDALAGGVKSNVVIGPFGSSLRVADYRTDGVPLIFVRHIRAAGGWDQTHFVSDAKAQELSSHLALPGDVLITKMGDPPGDVAVYSGRRPAVITADCIRLRVGPEMDAKFVALALRGPEARAQMLAITSGVAQKKMSLGRFRNSLTVAAPGLDEQRRIVEVLEGHLSRVDAAEQLIARSAARLRPLELLELQLAMDRPGAPETPLSAFVERVEAGRSFGGSAPPAKDDDWGIVKVSAMTWGAFRPAENKAVPSSAVDPRFEIKPGDLLVSRANTSAYVGAAVLVGETRPKLLLSDKSLRLVPRPGVDPWWLLAALTSPRARTQISALATGTKDSMRNISQANLLGVLLPDQDAEARAHVIRTREESVERATRLSWELQLATAKVRSLRRSLLAAAFDGRLTEPGKDNNFKDLAHV